MTALRRPADGRPLYQVVPVDVGALVPLSVVLRDGVEVARRYGWTRAGAHRRALLAMAKMLEKDLTGIYQR